MEEEYYTENGESDTQSDDSNDSEYDPTSDILEKTQANFSKLSIKKKSKAPVAKDLDLGSGIDPDEVEVDVPELDEKDEKVFKSVQKIIEAAQPEKLKVDQCKVYLRKYGLRLGGSKAILIQRIKEHQEIMNGGGEKKYPVSSFVMNCKGDACTGDVVMFEQNVYEMFSIASRSASGPPCGTRTVAGRIVKESYGAAKQQHTFTIEVLWSKGEKALPPLYPLLIKGRNLYRFNTLRQRWEDEGERQKLLNDKHSRGAMARSEREDRIQKKEMRKMLKSARALGKEDPKNAMHKPVVLTASTILVSHDYQGTSKKIDIPNGRVGTIIGKGGETIKYLQLQSGAKIQVTRDTDVHPGSLTRTVDLMGTPEQIAKAEQLINDFLSQAESGGSGIVSQRITGQIGVERFVMKVPNNKVGLIIGKGGETIKSMRSTTGAHIQVKPLHLPPGDTSTERMLQIDGTTEQIELAKQMVNAVIGENRNPAIARGYSQQGYQARPTMQQPDYGYGKPNIYI